MLALMLCFAVAFAVVACNNDNTTAPADDDEDDTVETVTPLITNGDFATYSGSNQPYTPGTWTATNESSSKATSDYLLAGVVDVGSAYDTNKATWGGIANPGKANADDDDNDLLMIYIKPSSDTLKTYTYYSYNTSFTAAIGAYYKVTVNAYVASIAGETTDGGGAYIRFSNSAYAKFGPIKATSSWQTYTFYVQGSNITTSTIGISLALGMSDNKSTGYAFFDNAVATKITSAEYAEAQTQYANDEKVDFYSILTPDAEFINTTDTIDVSSTSTANWDLMLTPADWTGAKGTGNGGTASSSTSNLYSGIINTDISVWMDTVTKYGTNPGVREGAPDKNILLLYSFANNPTSYNYTGKRNVQFPLGHYYELSVNVYTELFTPQGAIKDYAEASGVTAATVGTYYTRNNYTYTAVTLTGSNYDSEKTYYKRNYAIDGTVTSTTSGTYYTKNGDSYTQVTLPAAYVAGTDYYQLSGYTVDDTVTNDTVGTYYTQDAVTYTAVNLDGTATTKFVEGTTYYSAIREVVSANQGAWVTLSGSDDYEIGSITTNGKWTKVTFMVIGNAFRNKDFTIKLSIGNGGSDDKDTLTYGTVAFDGLTITDKGVIENRTALHDEKATFIQNNTYSVAILSSTAVGTYYVLDGETYTRVELDGTNFDSGKTYYTKNYYCLIDLQSINSENADLSNELIEYANFSAINNDAATLPEGETLGLPTGWQFDAVGNVVVENDVDVKLSVIGKDVIETYVLPTDEAAQYVLVGNWYQKYDAANSAHAGLTAVDYKTVKEAYTKYWTDNYGLSGNPELPYDTLAPIVMVNNKIASAYQLSMSQKITVKPNTSYRLAAWVKTMDVASGKGITAALTDSTGTVFSSLTGINTASYTNELTSNYVELTFYINGNALISHSAAAAADANEYTFSISLGSGTAYTPSTFVQGAFLVANVNMEQITYTEYSAATSGTYCAKKDTYTNSATVTNGNFNSVDLEKTEIDSEGRYKELAAMPSAWSVYNTENSKTMEDFNVGILNVNNILDTMSIYPDLTARSLSDFDSIYNTGDTNPWKGTVADALRTPEMVSAPNLAVINTKGVSTIGYKQALKSPAITLSSSTYSAIKLYVKTVDYKASTAATSPLKAEIRLTTSSANYVTQVQTIATDGKWQEVVFYIRVGIVSSVSCNLEFYVGSEKDSNETYSGTILVDGISYYTIDAAAYDKAEANDSITTINFTTDTFSSSAESSTPTKPSNWTNTGTSTSGYIKSDSQVAGIFDKKFGDTTILGIRNQIAEDTENNISADNTVKNGSKLTVDMLFDETLKAGTDTSELEGGTFSLGNGLLLINNLNPGYYTYKTASITLPKDSYYAISVYARTYFLEYATNAVISVLVGDDSYTFGKVNTSEYSFAEAADGEYVKIDNDYVKYDKTNTAHNGLTRYACTESFGGWTKYTYYFRTYESTALSSVTLNLTLGSSDNKILGYALFDNVSIYTIDADAYDKEFAKVYLTDDSGEPVLVDDKALNKEYVAYNDLTFKKADVTASTTGFYIVKNDSAYSVINLNGSNFNSSETYYVIDGKDASEFSNLVAGYNAAQLYLADHKVVRYDDKIDCTHEWNSETGICNICGEVCEHDYQNGTCTICGHTDPDYKPDEDVNTDYLWAYISSIAIAVILLVVIIVMLVKWFAPKRKRKQATPDYDKSKVAKDTTGKTATTEKDKYKDE